MKKLISLALVGILLFSVTGCSSFAGRIIGATDKGIDYSGIYPGMRISFDFFFDPDCIDKEIKKKITPGIRAPLVIIGIIDFPISFAFDTLFLPFDFVFWLAQPEAK